MALGWITVLKLVPWGGVIEATPQIVQAAKKLLGSTKKKDADTFTNAAPTAGIHTESPAPVALQLQHLQERLVRLEQAHQASAVLIQSLAEQNAQVVQAVEALRKRSQRLTVAVSVLAITLVGLWAWILSQG